VFLILTKLLSEELPAAVLDFEVGLLGKFYASCWFGGIKQAISL
jgi:hypothetical protein